VRDPIVLVSGDHRLPALQLKDGCMEPRHRLVPALYASQSLLRLRQELNEEKDSRVPDSLRVPDSVAKRGPEEPDQGHAVQGPEEASLYKVSFAAPVALGQRLSARTLKLLLHIMHDSTLVYNSELYII